jgi:hypothetical protein
MKKILFYALTGEKMCFQHVLMNALDLHNSGFERVGQVLLLNLTSRTLVNEAFYKGRFPMSG